MKIIDWDAIEDEPRIAPIMRTNYGSPASAPSNGAYKPKRKSHVKHPHIHRPPEWQFAT